MGRADTKVSPMRACVVPIMYFTLYRTVPKFLFKRGPTRHMLVHLCCAHTCHVVPEKKSQTSFFLFFLKIFLECIY